jgi:hypothetical protein
MNDLNTSEDQASESVNHQTDQRDMSSESRHRHSRHHHHSTERTRKPQKKKTSFESIMSNEILIILAALFIVGGFIWIIIKSDTIPIVSRLVNNFFSVVEDEEHSITKTGPDGGAIEAGSNILLHLLPAILLLAYALYNKILRKGSRQITFIAFVAGAGLLYSIQIAEHLYPMVTRTSFPYSSLPLATGITLFMAILVVWYTSTEHKAWIHTFSIGFIFIMTILLAIGYGITNHWLFVMIFAFGAFLFAFSGKTTGSIVNTANAWTSMLYFGIYFIRKIHLKSSIDQLWIYLGYASVLLIAIYLIRLFKPYQGKSLWKAWFADSAVYGVTAFFIGTMAFAMRKFGLSHLIWVMSLGVVGVQLLIIGLSKQIRPEGSRAVFYYSIVFVASSILPFAVRKNIYLLYSGVVSILLVTFAKQRQHPFAAILAVISLSAGFITQLALTVVRYYPELYFRNTNLPSAQFLLPFASGLVLTLAAWVVYKIFSRIGFPYSQKWFSRSNTAYYVLSLFYASLYLTSFWLFQYLFFSMWNVEQAHIVSWYIFHLVFFFLVLRFVVQQKSWVYKPILWIAVASMFAWPLAINFFIIALRDQAMLRGGVVMGSFDFHFIGIIPAIALSWFVSDRLKSAYPKFKEGATLQYIFRIGIFFYLLIAEYDHFSVWMSPVGQTGNDIIQANRYLPYTIIFALLSLTLMLFAFAKHVSLLRQFSLVVLFITVMKIFIIDFASYSPAGKALAFMLTGAFLILYSLLYRQLSRTSFRVTAPEPKERSEHQHRSRRRSSKE